MKRKMKNKVKAFLATLLAGFAVTLSVGASVATDGVREAKAADDIVLDLTTKAASCNAYNTKTTYGDWIITYGANNSKSWAYFKMGGKSEILLSANPCLIDYTKKVENSVTSVDVNIVAGSFAKSGMSVKSWGVKVFSDSDKTQLVEFVEGGTITKDAKLFTFTPSSGDSWSSNYYYQVYWDLANTTTTNGIICVDNVTIHLAQDPSAVKHFVNFNANGGANSQTSVQVNENSTYTLPAETTFTAPEGKKFDGWSAEPNGAKITTIDVGTEDVTVYARWIDIPVYFALSDIKDISENTNYYLSNDTNKFASASITSNGFSLNDEPTPFNLIKVENGYKLKTGNKFVGENDGKISLLDNVNSAAVWTLDYYASKIYLKVNKYLGYNSETNPSLASIIKGYAISNLGGNAGNKYAPAFLWVDNPGVLTGISVDSSKITDYDVNTEFVKPEIIANFGTGASYTVTNACVFSDVDMTSAGTKTVNVSYTFNGVTKETSYDINVSADAIVSATIFGRVKGRISNDWDLSEIVLKYTTQKGNTGTVTEGFTASTTTAIPSAAGKYSVTVDVTGFDVSVESKTFENVEIFRETSTAEDPLTVHDCAGIIEYYSDYESASNVYVKGTGSIISGKYYLVDGDEKVQLYNILINNEKMSSTNFVDGQLYIAKGVLKNYYGAELTCADSSNNDTECNVVVVALQSISVQSTLFIEAGDSKILEVTFNPTNASNRNITWESSDESVATVENGVVTGLKAGTATITAKSEDGNFTSTCEVTVNAIKEFNYVKYLDESLTEGNYLIQGNKYSGLLKAEINGNYVGGEATVYSDGDAKSKISNVTAKDVWKLSKEKYEDVDYWTIYNEYTDSYVSSVENTKNKATLLKSSEVTNRKTILWTLEVKKADDKVTGYEFANLERATSQSDPNNKYLRENSVTAGLVFACYTSSTNESCNLFRQVPKYTISYDTNGATGTAPESQRLEEGATYNVAAGTGLAKEGYDFGGWKLNNEGDPIAAGTEQTATADAAYTAVWNAIVYSVTYNANGAEGEAPAKVENIAYGASVNAPDATDLTKTGYTFDGWNTAADGSGTAYAVGAEIAPTPDNRNIVLYAQWTANDQTVTLTGDNHSSIEGETSVKYDASYSATIKFDEYYVKDSVVITMGGNDITETALDGNEISIAIVTGDITIQVVSKIAAEFSASFSGEHVTSSNDATTLNVGSTYETTLTADANFAINEVVVKMGGVVVDGAFDAATGKVTIPTVTNDVQITATVNYLADFTLSATELNKFTGDADAAITISEEHNFDETTKVVTWTSNNEEVATVNNGLVTFVGAGNATITVTIKDSNNIEISHTVTVTVTQSSSTLVVDKDTLALSGNESKTVTATVGEVVGNQDNEVTVSYDATKISVLANGSPVASGSKVASGTELTVISANEEVNIKFSDTITFTANGQTKTVAVNVDNRVEFTKVTSTDQLHEGDYVTFYNESASMILGDIQEGKTFLSNISDAKEGDKLLGTTGVLELQLVKVGDKWAFYLEGKGFLCCSTVKEVSFSETLTADCLFTIAFDESGNVLISNELGTFKYNSSSPRFTTYASGQQNIQLYVSETPNKTVAATGVTVTGVPEDNKVVVGNTLDLTAVVAPVDATNQTVTWTSSDTSVATVENGKVTALKSGTVTITVTAQGGEPITVTLTVINPVASVELDKTTAELEVGNTVTLTATITPTDADNKAVTWSSSDTSIATVDETGKVTAVAAGSVTITVTTADGAKTASCAVTVNNIPEPPAPAKGGCGGAIVASTGIMSMVAIAGIALVLSKRKDD